MTSKMKIINYIAYSSNIKIKTYNSELAKLYFKIN
jgi:hypothetical protein